MKKIIDNSQADGVFEDVGKDGWYKVALTSENGAANAVIVELDRKDNDAPDAEARIVATKDGTVQLTQSDPEKLVAVDSGEMLRARQTGGSGNITVTANRFDS